MIISLGFRINSKIAIKFRTWANKLLKNYIVKGYNLNEGRFMRANRSDLEHFDELLEKIKLIRTSERMFYQKITDAFLIGNNKARFPFNPLKIDIFMMH